MFRAKIAINEVKITRNVVKITRYTAIFARKHINFLKNSSSPPDYNKTYSNF